MFNYRKFIKAASINHVDTPAIKEPAITLHRLDNNVAGARPMEASGPDSGG